MELKPWGISLSLNLYDCLHDLLIQTSEVERYITEVIAVIDMKAHGPCYVERFGHGELEGISAMQFIETSSVTVHCDEVSNRVFIDIFTCKDLDAKKAIEFSERFFQAKSSHHVIISR